MVRLRVDRARARVRISVFVLEVIPALPLVRNIVYRT